MTADSFLDLHDDVVDGAKIQVFGGSAADPVSKLEIVGVPLHTVKIGGWHMQLDSICVMGGGDNGGGGGQP